MASKRRMSPFLKPLDAYDESDERRVFYEEDPAALFLDDEEPPAVHRSLVNDRSRQPDPTKTKRNKEVNQLENRVEELTKLLHNARDQTLFLQGAVQEKENSLRGLREEKTLLLQEKDKLLHTNDILRSDAISKEAGIQMTLADQAARTKMWAEKKEILLLKTEKLRQLAEDVKEDTILWERKVRQRCVAEKEEALALVGKRFISKLSSLKEDSEKRMAAFLNQAEDKLKTHLNQWQEEKAGLLQTNKETKLVLIKAHEEIQLLRRSREEAEQRWAALLRENQEQPSSTSLASTSNANEQKDKELAEKREKELKLLVKRDKEQEKELKRLTKMEKRKKRGWLSFFFN